MNEMWKSQNLDCHTYLGIRNLREALDSNGVAEREREVITREVDDILSKPQITDQEYSQVSQLLKKNSIIIGEAKTKETLSDEELQLALNTLWSPHEAQEKVLELLDRGYTLAIIKDINSPNPNLGFILVKRIES